MSGLSAAELFGRVALAGLATPLRLHREACACGGEIVANADDPGPAVAQHNRTAVHRAWWARVRVAWQGEEAAA